MELNHVVSVARLVIGFDQFEREPSFQSKEAVRKRDLLIRVVRDVTGASFPSIARAVGSKSHSTIRVAIERNIARGDHAEYQRVRDEVGRRCG